MPAVDIARASVVPKALVSELIEKRELLDSAGIVRALKRMAHEIVERNATVGDVVLVGIRTAGVPLAERLAGFIADAAVSRPRRAPSTSRSIATTCSKAAQARGRHHHAAAHTIVGRTIILVDDVLYTGRTIRAALDALMDYGRPRAVQLAVLVDRGHRELPIQPDYVGLKVETTRNQSVKVILDGATARC